MREETNINIILRPLRWLRRRFPGLEFESAFIAVVGCVLLVLYLYHGKPGSFYLYFPSWAGEFSRATAGLLSYCYSHLATFFFLMLVPLVLARCVLRHGVRNYGLRFAGAQREFGIALCLYLALLPVLVYVASTPTFQKKYPLLQAAETDVLLFWLYEAAFLVKWVAWEFFFRGFLLFGLKKRFGESAILFSTLAFCLAHLGKPEAEVLASIAAGFVLCRLALDGKSIFPGVFLHFLVAGTMDFLTSSWWR